MAIENKVHKRYTNQKQKINQNNNHSPAITTFKFDILNENRNPNVTKKKAPSILATEGEHAISKKLNRILDGKRMNTESSELNEDSEQNDYKQVMKARFKKVPQLEKHSNTRSVALLPQSNFQEAILPQQLKQFELTT